MVLGWLLLALPGHASAENAIKWYSHEEGLVLGKLEQKKLFVHFYADWCRYCKKMQKETFQDEDVIAYLNANYVPVKVNTDRERQTAAQYGIRPLPDSWFLTPDGQRISNQPGYIDAQMLIEILKYIHTDSYLDTSFKKFVQSRK